MMIWLFPIWLSHSLKNIKSGEPVCFSCQIMVEVKEKEKVKSAHWMRRAYSSRGLPTPLGERKRGGGKVSSTPTSDSEHNVWLGRVWDSHSVGYGITGWYSNSIYSVQFSSHFWGGFSGNSEVLSTGLADWFSFQMREFSLHTYQRSSHSNGISGRCLGWSLEDKNVFCQYKGALNYGIFEKWHIRVRHPQPTL